MCLSKIMTKQNFKRSAKDRIKYLNKTHYIGYKVVKRTRRNYLLPPFMKLWMGKHFEIGCPIVDEDRGGYIISRDGNFYDRGFHILCSLSDAIIYSSIHFPLESDKIIVKVYVPIDSVTTYGTQDDCFTYVSQKFTIPSQYPLTRKGVKLDRLVD